MKPILRNLSELCVPQIPQCDPREHPAREIFYVDIGSVNNRTKRIETPRRLKGSEASVRARQIIRQDDVLVSTVRPNLNAVAKVEAELDGQICSTGFCVLRCDRELLPGYLFAFVQSRLFVGSLVELVQGALYPAVTDKQILAQKLPWLPVEEQEAIACRFAAQISTLTDARTAAVEQLNEAQMLARKLREDFQSQLRAADRVLLDDLLLGIDAGKSFQTNERLASDNELGVLKVSAVSWGEFKPNEAKAVSADYVPDERHRVRAGDVIISRANTVELVGAVVRADRDYPNRLLSDKTLRLVLDERRCDPGYIVEILRLPEARAHLEGNATGTSDSMRNITQDTIRATAIALPSIREQQRLAARLHSFDRELGSLREAAQAQLREVTFLPERLLAHIFKS